MNETIQNQCLARGTTTLDGILHDINEHPFTFSVGFLPLCVTTIKRLKKIKGE